MNERKMRTLFTVDRIITYYPSYYTYCKLCNWKAGPWDYRSNGLKAGYEHVGKEHDHG